MVHWRLRIKRNPGGIAYCGVLERTDRGTTLISGREMEVPGRSILGMENLGEYQDCSTINIWSTAMVGCRNRVLEK